MLANTAPISTTPCARPPGLRPLATRAARKHAVTDGACHHQICSQHEKRNGQQRLAVEQRVHDLVGHQRRILLLDDEVADRAGDHRQCDGYAQNYQQREQWPQRPRMRHSLCSPIRSRGLCIFTPAVFALPSRIDVALPSRAGSMHLRGTIRSTRRQDPCATGAQMFALSKGNVDSSYGRYRPRDQ
jgi:hypothetical protein